MTISVNGPNGIVINFPDGTDAETISRVMGQAIEQQKPKGPSMLERAVDVPASIGTGAVKGAIGLAALPDTMVQAGKQGVDFLRGKLEQAGVPTPTFDGNMSKRMPGGMFVDMLTGPRGQPVTTGLPSYKGMTEAVEGVTGPMWEPKTTPGEFGEEIGSFLPGLAFPVGKAAQGAGRVAEFGSRLMRNVVAPAIGSEAAGQVTKGTPAEPVARILGSFAGQALPDVARRVATPYPVSPERLKMAKTLDKEGVRYSAGQLAGEDAQLLRYAESNAKETLGAGRRAAELFSGQKADFSRAALKRAGIQGEAATDDALLDASKRLGNVFDDIARKAKIEPARWAPKDLARRQQRLADIRKDYLENISVPPVKRVVKLLDDLDDMVATGTRMDGEKYQRWRRELDKSINKQRDPYALDALREIKEWLDDMVTVGLPKQQETVARWKDARRQWRNLQQIKDAKNKPGALPAEGIITPRNIDSAIANSGNRDLSRDARAFGGVRSEGQDTRFEQLARAGKAILNEPPNSGTPARMNLQLLASLVGGSVGTAMGGPAGGAAGFLAPAVTQALGSRLIMSPFMQAYLKNQMMQQLPPGQSSRLAAFGQALAQMPDQNK